MSIQDIINNEISEIEKDKNSVNRTIKDLLRQVDGTVALIKFICDKHGKDNILELMTEQERQTFELVWAKIESAAEGTDYIVPEI